MLENKIYFNSKIASTSTETPNGKLFVLTAALVCIPAFPKTEAIRSDAPFNTLGWSINSSVELTNPVNFTHDLIFDMRNLYSSSKIKQQGFKYYSVGK